MPAAVRLPGGRDERPRIEVALRYLPADDRDLWLRIGMAIKAGMGEDGFELWDHWSRSSARYRGTDARDVWRSLRPDGGISLATLFFEAERSTATSRAVRGRSVDPSSRRQRVRSPPPRGEGGSIPPINTATVQQCNATRRANSCRKRSCAPST